MRQFIFSISLLSPLGKGRGSSLGKTWILFTQRCFMPSLVKIDSVILKKKMKLWKVYRKIDDGLQAIRKSSLELSGELKRKWNINRKVRFAANKTEMYSLTSLKLKPCYTVTCHNVRQRKTSRCNGQRFSMISTTSLLSRQMLTLLMCYIFSMLGQRNYLSRTSKLRPMCQRTSNIRRLMHEFDLIFRTNSHGFCAARQPRGKLTTILWFFMLTPKVDLSFSQPNSVKAIKRLSQNIIINLLFLNK